MIVCVGSLRGQMENLDFTTTVRNLLRENYTVNGNSVRGQAVSYLRMLLRDEGFYRLGSCLADFERMLRQEGFDVEEGKNRRGQRAVVVFEGGAR